MDAKTFKIIELLLVFGLVLGFAFRELWLLKRERRRDEEKRRQQDGERDRQQP